MTSDAHRAEFERHGEDLASRAPAPTAAQMDLGARTLLPGVMASVNARTQRGRQETAATAA